MTSPRIGFIGQGWIGKNYALDFEERGFEVIRYALEEPFAQNKEAIATCDIVFIAVPTPTTTSGFDDTIIHNVLSVVGPGHIAIIKSTIIPGTTQKLQKQFPEILVLHSPEFLREATAREDAAHPGRNIIGIPESTPRHQQAAELVLSVLPTAPFARVMDARAAELVKYAGNVFLATKVVFANMLYDFAEALEVDYETIREALGADARIGMSHLQPVAASGHGSTPGRGAAGHCFIKDFEAFRLLYGECVEDTQGQELLASIVRKNAALLTASGKDIDLLHAVYGTKHTLLP